jgi:hypothetical protein
MLFTLIVSSLLFVFISCLSFGPLLVSKVQGEVVDKKNVLLWDLWFAVLQTLMHSLVAVLSVIVLCISASYLWQFYLILIQISLIFQSPTPPSCTINNQQPNQAGCRWLLYMSPHSQFALIFGVADNNCIMASICDIWDFGYGEELDCLLLLFWHFMFLWLILTCLSKPSAFCHEGGGSTFLQNATPTYKRTECNNSEDVSLNYAEHQLQDVSAVSSLPKPPDCLISVVVPRYASCVLFVSGGRS